MEADTKQTPATAPAKEQVTQPINTQTLHLVHPKLPTGATLIEKIALPMVFSVITSVVKNPDHAAELQEYMIAVRDAIDAAYPDA
jgi:hypothetical protein